MESFFFKIILPESKYFYSSELNDTKSLNRRGIFACFNMFGWNVCSGLSDFIWKRYLFLIYLTIIFWVNKSKRAQVPNRMRLILNYVYRSDLNILYIVGKNSGGTACQPINYIL